MNTKQTESTVTRENINGKSVPVAVHKPVNNGEAVNNSEIKDMSAQSQPVYMTMAEYKEMQRKDRELDTMNLWSVTITIMSKRVELGGIKFQVIDNKKSNVPLVDEDGEVLRYDSKYFIDTTYFGFGEPFQVSKNIFDDLEVGQKYLAKFHRGGVTNFGKTEPSMILDSFEYR